MGNLENKKRRIDRSERLLPAIYSIVLLSMAEERGMTRESATEGLGLPHDFMTNHLAKTSLGEYEALVRRVLDHIGAETELGYEFGMRIGLATLGMVGVAVLTRVDVQSAVEFLVKYSSLLTQSTRPRFFVENEVGIVELTFSHPEDISRFLYESKLVAMWRIVSPLLGDSSKEVELWFNYPMPSYYAEYRHRLPRCRFDTDAIRICIPQYLLDRTISFGDPVSAALLEEQCEREYQLFEKPDDVVARIRALLTSAYHYPDLASISRQLAMSSRTVNRKLLQSGTSYQKLLEEARYREACYFLRETELPITRISEKLGYADGVAFSHAFRKWTGEPPGHWRKKQVTKKPA
jgi:AraC-like DNA-binding protein